MTILDLSNQSTIYLSNESFNWLTRLQNLTLNDNKILKMKHLFILIHF
jgi:hypothetical protein